MGWIRTELARRLVEYWDDPRVRVRFLMNVQDVAAARNEAVMFHFDPISFTHVLLIDADTIPPSGFVDRLLAVNRPIVSGVTYILKTSKPNVGDGRPMLRPAIWRKQQYRADGSSSYFQLPEVPEEGVLEEPGLAAGCFCMLIQADVFAALRVPYFKTEYQEETQEKTRGEDIYFCAKAEEAGFPTTVACDVVCDHVKTISLNQVAMLCERTVSV